MWTEEQIEAAAIAAAEKAKGCKFTDPLFYKSEHRAFWREVTRTALDAADAASASRNASLTSVSKEEVWNFSEHCVYLRSVWMHMIRIWRDNDENERQLMGYTAPCFFADIDQALTQMMIVAACRITDPANSGGSQENFTVERFASSFASDPQTYKQLDALHQRMKKLRAKILPVRHKLGAIAGRDVIHEGQVLRGFEEWEDFWSALIDFVRIINEKTTGTPFEINAGGVFSDADMLFTALERSRLYEAL